MPEPLPDTKTHLSHLINALRMSAFPRVLYNFADAFSTTFVPTKTGARETMAKVIEIRNDAAFRHWICENASLEDATYCRMALHFIGDVMDNSAEEQMRAITGRIANAPLLCTITTYGLEMLERGLKQE